MIFDGREAKMTIWDCISTCLNESKSFRFTEEHFPEGVELVSQSHLDSLQALVDSKVVVDSLKSEAMNKLHFKLGSDFPSRYSLVEEILLYCITPFLATTQAM